MIDSSGITTVLFDFGETLFEPLPERFETRNLLNVKQGVHLDMPDQEFLKDFRAYKRQVVERFAERPFFFHREMIATALRLYLGSLSMEVSPEAIDSYCDAQRRAVISNLRPRADCVPTLTRLRSRGLQLGIVSNIDNAWLDPLIVRFQLDAWFDLIFTSEMAKSCKPDKKIFNEATRRLKCDAEQCLFVGDSERNDIMGANSVGMTSVLLRTNPSHERSQAALVVESLAEVVDLFSTTNRVTP